MHVPRTACQRSMDERMYRPRETID